MRVIWRSSTRFVGKPVGVSNVLLTYFDFFRGSIKTWGIERPQREVKPPNPLTNRALWRNRGQIIVR